jgi:hypothetical protein
VSGGTATAAETAIGRLEALGAELTRRAWTARLNVAHSRAPSLFIQNPEPGAAALSEHIYPAPKADAWWFWSVVGRADRRDGNRHSGDRDQSTAIGRVTPRSSAQKGAPLAVASGRLPLAAYSPADSLVRRDCTASACSCRRGCSMASGAAARCCCP